MALSRNLAEPARKVPLLLPAKPCSWRQPPIRPAWLAAS